MDTLHKSLEAKFENILSGQCLTFLREENKKIIDYHSANTNVDPDKRLNDFLIYIKNFLTIKGYETEEIVQNEIKAKIDQNNYDFVLDFDQGENQDEVLLKILDHGEKHGISKSESKYVFIVSTTKGVIVMMNLDRLKSSVREKKRGYRLISETIDGLKNQYVGIFLPEIVGSVKIFHLK